MASVFVSYAREDALKAKAIARLLEQASLDVWSDDRISSGAEFTDEIEKALDNAAAVLVLWSKTSINSVWVRDEATEGRDSGRLISILIDKCRPPLGFRQFQATDLTGWSGRGSPRQIEAVIAAIKAKDAAGAPAGPAVPAVGAGNSRRRIYGAAAAILAAIALVAGIFLFNRPDDGSRPAPTAALLPFSADASDTEARKLAAASREAVAHTLAQGAFAVSTIDAVPAGGAAPADFLITGQVTTTPDKVVVNVRMEETGHHVVVFTQQFEASRRQAWELPERVGAQTASQLSWTAPIIAMELRHSSDPAIIAALLQSSAAGLNGTAALSDYERSRKLATTAPNSPLAQDNFAFGTALALAEIPRDQRRDAVAAARLANERTVKLAPEYAGGYIAWCVLHSEVRLLDCEKHLRAGMRADPDASFANFFLGQLFNSVGRNREGAELIHLSLAHDPYMPYKIALALRMMEVGGRTQEADELYRQSERWWPGNEVIVYWRRSGMVQRGDFGAVLRFAREADPHSAPDPVVLALAGNSESGVKAACAQPTVRKSSGVICMLGLAKFGDLDAAYALANLLYPSRLGSTPADEDRLWLDDPNRTSTAYLASAAAAPLRRDPRFLAVAARVGLLDYWRSGRLPDFCTIAHEPVCAVIGHSPR